MRTMLLSALLLLAVTACSGGDPAADSVPADSLTREQRDSALGASSLPGAGGVRRSLEIADSAAARQAAIDSIRD